MQIIEFELNIINECSKKEQIKDVFLNILKNGPKISTNNDNITREWIHNNGVRDGVYR